MAAAQPAPLQNAPGNTTSFERDLEGDARSELLGSRSNLQSWLALPSGQAIYFIGTARLHLMTGIELKASKLACLAVTTNYIF